MPFGLVRQLTALGARCLFSPSQMLPSFAVQWLLPFCSPACRLGAMPRAVHAEACRWHTGLMKLPTVWVLAGFHWVFTSKPRGFRAAVS